MLGLSTVPPPVQYFSSRATSDEACCCWSSQSAGPAVDRKGPRSYNVAPADEGGQRIDRQSNSPVVTFAWKYTAQRACLARGENGPPTHWPSAGRRFSLLRFRRPRSPRGHLEWLSRRNVEEEHTSYRDQWCSGLQEKIPAPSSISSIVPRPHGLVLPCPDDRLVYAPLP